MCGGNPMLSIRATRYAEREFWWPDILVVEPNVSPVAIEAEVPPAITVESEALSRLGNYTSDAGRTILSAVAVRLPARIRTSKVISCGAKWKPRPTWRWHSTLAVIPQSQLVGRAPAGSSGMFLISRFCAIGFDSA